LTLSATITGYKCKLWGQYPALVDGPLDATIQGIAYEVQGPDEKAKLEAYEGEIYVLENCLIKLQDGSQILGSTFKWRGDQRHLREGSFDLKDWKMKNLDIRGD